MKQKTQTTTISSPEKDAATRTLPTGSRKRGARPTNARKNIPSPYGFAPLPGVQTCQVGAVQWAYGNTYPVRDTLKAAGYRWNNGKRAWSRPADTIPATPARRVRSHTLGSYEGQRRRLAREVKAGALSAIEDAAERLACLVRENAVLVPMPSSTGRATVTRALCERMAALVPGATVADVLKADPHESNYTQKKRTGGTCAPVRMERTATLPAGRPVYIVDNVVDTGTTARAALAAIPEAEVVALAHTTRTPAALLPDMADHARNFHEPARN